MPLSTKAASNILRLLHTEDERNGALAFRLLNGQKVTDDFLLSLCGNFMVARGEPRLFLRQCLRTLLRIIIAERHCPPRQEERLLWLLNYDPEQAAPHPEEFLHILRNEMAMETLPLARFLFSRSGHCASLLFKQGDASDRAAMLANRKYEGAYGQTLDLSRMQLTNIPDDIRPFTQLHGIDLSHNSLRLSDVFALQPFSHLRFLNLAYNRLEKIPEGLHLLPDLQEIDLRTNSFKLRIFEYLRHPLKKILKVSLVMEPGFTLSQFNNQDLGCILKNWIYDTGQGQILNLSGKEIRSVPEAIQFYPQLAFIDLRNVPIGFLPLWILRMPNLREIYCDRGVEYNPAFCRKGLIIYRDKEQDPPAPGENPAPWLSNLANFPAELPVTIPMEGLIG